MFDLSVLSLKQMKITGNGSQWKPQGSLSKILRCASIPGHHLDQSISPEMACILKSVIWGIDSPLKWPAF
jgi:hypothetical protein